MRCLLPACQNLSGYFAQRFSVVFNLSPLIRLEILKLLVNLIMFEVEGLISSGFTKLRNIACFFHPMAATSDGNVRLVSVFWRVNAAHRVVKPRHEDSETNREKQSWHKETWWISYTCLHVWLLSHSQSCYVRLIPLIWSKITWMNHRIPTIPDVDFCSEHKR